MLSAVPPAASISLTPACSANAIDLLVLPPGAPDVHAAAALKACCFDFLNGLLLEHLLLDDHSCAGELIAMPTTCCCWPNHQITSCTDVIVTWHRSLCSLNSDSINGKTSDPQAFWFVKGWKASLLTVALLVFPSSRSSFGPRHARVLVHHVPCVLLMDDFFQPCSTLQICWKTNKTGRLHVTVRQDLFIFQIQPEAVLPCCLLVLFWLQQEAFLKLKQEGLPIFHRRPSVVGGEQKRHSHKTQHHWCSWWAKNTCRSFSPHKTMQPSCLCQEAALGGFVCSHQRPTDNSVPILGENLLDIGEDYKNALHDTPQGKAWMTSAARTADRDSSGLQSFGRRTAPTTAKLEFKRCLRTI
jgi:hypothetical protein